MIDAALRFGRTQQLPDRNPRIGELVTVPQHQHAALVIYGNTHASVVGVALGAIEAGVRFRPEAHQGCYARRQGGIHGAGELVAERRPPRDAVVVQRRCKSAEPGRGMGQLRFWRTQQVARCRQQFADAARRFGHCLAHDECGALLCIRLLAGAGKVRSIEREAQHHVAGCMDRGGKICIHLRRLLRAVDRVKDDGLRLARRNIARCGGPDRTRPRPAAKVLFQRLKAGVIHINNDDARVGRGAPRSEAGAHVIGAGLQETKRARGCQQEHECGAFGRGQERGAHEFLAGFARCRHGQGFR